MAMDEAAARPAMQNALIAGLALALVGFAANPAEAIVGALDFTNPIHTKFHRNAVAPLKKEFGLEPAQLKDFLEELHDRATHFGWLQTMHI